MLVKDELIRDKNRIIGGVCAAIAKKQNFNPWILRALFLFFLYFFYYTIIFYLLIWIYIPNQIKIEQKELNKVGQ